MGTEIEVESGGLQLLERPGGSFLCYSERLVSRAAQSRKPGAREGQPAALVRSGGRKKAPTTAADAPLSVRRLLKSYELKDVRWSEDDDRHVMVVAILTRGDAAAKRWLWSVLSESEVRELVRRYRGAGCAEPDRDKLRKQLDLSVADIPARSYLGMERGIARRDSGSD